MKLIKNTILSLMIGLTSTMVIAKDTNVTKEKATISKSVKIKKANVNKEVKIAKINNKAKATKDAKMAKISNKAKATKDVKMAKINNKVNATKDAKNKKVKKLLKKVNINTATAKELTENLKGIGLKKAQAIIAHRNKFGKFKNVKDLLEVKGIGQTILKNNMSSILF